MTAPFNTIYIDGGAPLTGDGVNTFIQNVLTVPYAQAFIGTQGMVMYLLGTDAVGDGGEGFFYWNPNGTAPDDNGVTTIAPAGASGVWTRLVVAITAPDTIQAVAAVSLDAGSVTTLVVAGQAGTMVACQIAVSNVYPGAGDGLADITVTDGNGNFLASTSVGMTPSFFVPTALILALNGVNVPFSNGAKVAISVSGVTMTGNADVNFYYVPPA